MDFAREPGRTKHCLFFPHSPLCSFHLQPLFTHLNVSDSGADYCHVTRTSECQKSGNEGSFSAEAEWASPTSATISIDSIAAALAWKSAREFPWYSCLVPLVQASILMTDDILYQGALDFQAFYIISGTLTISTSEDTTLRKNTLMLLLIWQCFSCNSIYEESLTSLTNILGCSRGPLEKPQSFF